MASAAPPPDASHTAHQGIAFWWPVCLVFGVALLTSHSRAAEIPFSLLAFMAPYYAWRQGRRFWDHPAARLLLLLFACYWLPMLAALPDALDFPKSALQTVAALRFPLAGLTILALLRLPEQIVWLYRLVAVLIVFWAGDALVQHALGYNLLGMPDLYPRLSGVFGNDYLRLGLYSALLSPFLLHQVQFRGRMQDGSSWLPGMLWLMGLLLLLVVVWLSGTRSGWIMAALALGLWGWYGLRRGRGSSGDNSVPSRWAALGLVALSGIVLATVVLSYYNVPSVRQRVNQTVQVFSGDEQVINQALSYRLPIWRHAWAISGDYPVNGVGPRGFRQAYSLRAGNEDYFMQKEGMGASHAHQLQLSIATETGAIGLLAFTLGVFWFWRSWHNTAAAGRCLLAPAALTLLLAVFPLNSHLDAYASSPALMFWWLLAVYLAAWRQVQPQPLSSAAPAAVS